MLSTLNFGSSEPISQKDLKEKDGNSINASIFNELQDQEVLQNINRLDGYITENRGQVSNNSVRYYIQGKDVGFLDDGVLFEITESVQVKSPESGSRESTAIIDRPYPEGNINDIRMKYEDSENEYPYRGLPRSNGEIYWSQIEVISEPVFGQDFNTGNSVYSAMAVENGNIYVVWTDINDTSGAGTDGDIFYRYFDGNIWSTIQVISEPVPGQNFNTLDSFYPAIAVENSNIYVVWQDLNNTNGAGTDNDIFYRTNLTGSGWEDVQVISEPVSGQNYNTANPFYLSPDIAVENDNVYVVWVDTNNTNGAGPMDADIHYRCNLTGSSWEDIQVISEPVPFLNWNIGISSDSHISVKNGKIYTVWRDTNITNGAGSDYDIFFRYFDGNTWSKIQVVSEPIIGSNTDTKDSIRPDVAVDNGKVYVVWDDMNNTNGAGGDRDIFYRYFDGTSWTDIDVISEPIFGNNVNTGHSNSPEITVENGNIYVVWMDENNTNGAGLGWDIFYRANITGSNWEGVQVISEPVFGQNFNTAANCQQPSIAVEGGIVGVAWTDTNNTNGSGTDMDISYRRTSLMNLLLPKVTPTSGNTSTYFNFTVQYFHKENTAPTEISVNISGNEYPLVELDSSDTNYMDGKDYFFNITHLDIGVHTYRFYTTDGITPRFTMLVNKPEVYNTAPNITTVDNNTALEDVYYEVVYTYEDIDIANVGQLGYWHYSTNASWIAFDNITAILNGTPTNDDVGTYWVNISINDTIEIDWTNFTLTVIDVNDDPVINTTDVETTYEDELYKVDYNATDIDSLLEDHVWSLDTNATSWLDIDQSMGIISGTPTNDDVGSYWVNVSVIDGDNGLAFTNFSLIVINVNDPPEIITEDILKINSSELYEVDYNATDIDSPSSQFSWSVSTNATWLDIDSSTGVLNGTPLKTDAGRYNVNVTLNDGDDGLDWHDFVLEVIKKNDPPIITTTDVSSATVDISYQVQYEATDEDTPLDKLMWFLDTNASWLGVGPVTGILRGTPRDADLGSYWVKVTVSDGEGGFDSHNFTLTVYSTLNQPPEITTEDDINAVVGEIYTVDYEATDDRTPVNNLNWSLKTNASWLTMHGNTGLLSGTPELSDIGRYIVNVTVFDGEDGWDYHNFVLIVSTEPIEENNAPELSNPTLTPSEGDVETEFTFTVHYYDEDGDAPNVIKIFIDNGSYDMTLKDGEEPANGVYTFIMKLSEGNHTFYFTASDGTIPVTTSTYSTPYINKIVDVDDGETEKDSEIDWWIWALIIIIIVVVLVLIFLFVLNKKPGEEPAIEEPAEQALAPEAPPPVVEQPPTTEVPPEPAPTPKQPHLPEVPPEQVPSPDTPPSEQPQVPTEQPPTPEATPQVPQPQVESAPTQPEPIPQLEEQSAPQVEPQPQVEVQEPAVEQPAEPQPQPVPKVKTQPTIEENDA